MVFGLPFAVNFFSLVAAAAAVDFVIVISSSV
jgi:hypothetical protein